MPSLSLKELATYFAIPHHFDVGGGMEAQFLYRKLSTVPRATRSSVKLRLLTYNRDDLDATVAARCLG